MSSFKEWLVIESLIKDVIGPIQTQISKEVVLEEFFRQFCEATGDNYYKDHELDCDKCGYHGRFEDKGPEGLECPQCQKTISDADVRECEHCPYVGKFDEKDDQNICPRCGKAEVIETPDPFADGEEDAKPIDIDHDAIEAGRKEAEKARAEEEAKELRRKADEEARKTKRRGKGREISDHERQFATRLKNNALWVRWHAMMERKLDIDRLKKILAEYEKANPVSESILSFDDDEEDETESKSSGLEEAEEILTRLGYIVPDRMIGMRAENRDKTILKAMRMAVQEKGNDVPEEVAAELIKPIVGKDGKTIADRWGRPKTQPSEKVRAAKEKLIGDLSGLSDSEEPNPFERSFRSVARKDAQSFTGAKKGVKGHMYFSDPEDVANEFATDMLKMLTSRKVTVDGKPSKWGNVAGSAEGDVSDDDSADSMFRSWKQRIFGLARTAAQDTRSPTARSKDEVKRRNEVNSRMNKDINAAKSALYAKSLVDSGKSMPEVAEIMGIKENELNQMLKDPYSSLRFHINYLERLRRGEENSVVATSDEDKHRLELMKQIVIKASPQIGITLNPKDIIQTLETYRDHYAQKYRAKLTFAGQSGDESSGGDELSRGFDALAKARSDDDQSGRGGVFSGASSNATASSMAMNKDAKREMVKRIYEGLAHLHQLARSAKPQNRGGPGSRQVQYWWALTICIQLGLPYDAKTGYAKILSDNEITDELLDNLFNEKSSKTGRQCFQYLRNITSMSINQLYQTTKQILVGIYGPKTPKEGGGEIKLRSAQDWLNDGLKELCDFLKRKQMSI